MTKMTTEPPVPAAKRAGATEQPSPSPFMFRPKTAGESDKEYEDLKARAKLKFDARHTGRAKAVKGMVQARKGPS
jgi:hypothetical protein